MKKQSVMLVPQGHPTEWGTFWAPSFEIVWPSGKVGRKLFNRKPSQEEKKVLLSNITVALRKVGSYRKELERARKALQNVK